MIVLTKRFTPILGVVLLANLMVLTAPRAQERVLISYGGFNKTVGPV